MTQPLPTFRRSSRYSIVAKCCRSNFQKVLKVWEKVSKAQSGGNAIKNFIILNENVCQAFLLEHLEAGIQVFFGAQLPPTLVYKHGGWNPWISPPVVRDHFLLLWIAIEQVFKFHSFICATTFEVQIKMVIQNPDPNPTCSLSPVPPVTTSPRPLTGAGKSPGWMVVKGQRSR